MTRIYGHRWTSSFGDEIDPGNVWGAALRGLTMPMIKTGLSAMVAARMEWPPSAVEFLKLCEGGGDIPSINSALMMFLRVIATLPSARNWADLHPAIYWVYQEIGGYECDRLDTESLTRRFREQWPVAVEKAKAGELVSPPELQLEKPQEKPITEEDRAKGRDVLDSLKNLLNTRGEKQ